MHIFIPFKHIQLLHHLLKVQHANSLAIDNFYILLYYIVNKINDKNLQSKLGGSRGRVN